ncbi:MHYT domain-containing protein [Streptomyces sp. NPDC051286]|uniref:MHYT domain-containing protein n=1 Tax=Streptomyces sp. NPDC051286 TaxID=3365647 RepID=UPI0037B6083F
MGHLDHATFGWLTPALSYAMAAIGAALGLSCTVRALDTSGRSRRNWLITAASALGTGIWTMHFVAMLGFGVTGTEIRYNVPLTLLSLLGAMLVVGCGVFAVGYSRDRTRALAVGGFGTGLGVASMHYLGMAALRLHGAIHYDPLRVVLSVVIAVVAATAALWAALNIKSSRAVALASLVMGAAVSSMHYTGMMAVRVSVTPSGVRNRSGPPCGAFAGGDRVPRAGSGACAGVEDGSHRRSHGAKPTLPQTGRGPKR